MAPNAGRILKSFLTNVQGQFKQQKIKKNAMICRIQEPIYSQYYFHKCMGYVMPLSPARYSWPHIKWALLPSLVLRHVLFSRACV